LIRQFRRINRRGGFFPRGVLRSPNLGTSNGLHDLVDSLRTRCLWRLPARTSRVQNVSLLTSGTNMASFFGVQKIRRCLKNTSVGFAARFPAARSRTRRLATIFPSRMPHSAPDAHRSPWCYPISRGRVFFILLDKQAPSTASWKGLFVTINRIRRPDARQSIYRKVPKGVSVLRDLQG
jgi:hypothetical protein